MSDINVELDGGEELDVELDTSITIAGVVSVNGKTGVVVLDADDVGAQEAEEGKGLSTNDYDDTEKAAVAANTAARHTHSNKSVLDGITSALVSAWNTAKDWVTTNGANVLTHLANSVVHITASERTTWNGKSSVSVSSTGTATDVVKYITIDGVESKLPGGGSGGTTDFDELDNRPSYNGTTMSSSTNIPEVKTSTWDGKQDAISDLATIRSNASSGATAATNLNGHTVQTNVPAGAVFTDTIGLPVVSALTGWNQELSAGSVTPSLTLPTPAASPAVSQEIVYIFTAASANATFTPPSGYILGDEEDGFVGMTAGTAISYTDLTTGSIYEASFKVLDSTHIALIKKEHETA